MAVIYIDNSPYEVEDGQSLLSACLGLGFDIPYFCWHPAMHSVGACRQCSVKLFRDENDTRGMIVMSCMTPVEDGMRLSVDDPDARRFRAGIIELLMLNHPHDCPVCDEGGECHLQDMTVMTGHVRRKSRFPKRTHRNQDLGPFINHEMNRCIQCYRCVRFYRDYAGGRDFNVFGIHHHVYFGRFADGRLESEFSGNLVEICPTGVFTDKTFARHFTRKWDLQTAPSICVHCSLGCNTIPGERYGMLRRILNRYNHEVNGYFLCDRGRFGYEFVNSETRLRRPLIKTVESGDVEPVAKATALSWVADVLRNSNGVIGIGSPRASLESNFALRALVGPDAFVAGVSDVEWDLISRVLDIMRSGPVRTPSLHEVETADAVFVLGEDIPNTAPRMALTIRQSVQVQPMAVCELLEIPEWNDSAVRLAVQEAKGPLFVATPFATRLDTIATGVYRGAPDDLARLGFAVAHELASEFPGVPDLPESVASLAKEIAKALTQAQRPLVISGTSCLSRAVVEGANAIALALLQVGHTPLLSFVVPECNSLGSGMLGGKPLSWAQDVLSKGAADTVIVLENDLYRRMGSKEAEDFLGSAGHVIVLDSVRTRSTALAHAVLPAGTFAESSGTLVSNEGRAQRFFQVMSRSEKIQASWIWIRDIAAELGRTEAKRWHSLDGIVSDMAKSIPELEAIKNVAPGGHFRVKGMKIAREPHRYSGRTAMLANVTVHEPKPPDDQDSPLAFSMEGYQQPAPPPLIPRFWWPRWNSVQSVNKFQSEIAGPLTGGDPGIRLIEPAETPNVGLSAYQPPSAFTIPEELLVAVPLYHVFGSEELSALGPAIVEVAAEPSVAIGPEDAKRFALNRGDEAEIVMGAERVTLPVHIREDVPEGVIGLPNLVVPCLASIAKKEHP